LVEGVESGTALGLVGGKEVLFVFGVEDLGSEGTAF
jgi:hypothetical protein